MKGPEAAPRNRLRGRFETALQVFTGPCQSYLAADLDLLFAFVQNVLQSAPMSVSCWARH